MISILCLYNDRPMHNQSFLSNIFGMFNDCVQLNNVSKCNLRLTSKWMLPNQLLSISTNSCFVCMIDKMLYVNTN